MTFARSHLRDREFIPQLGNFADQQIQILPPRAVVIDGGAQAVAAMNGRVGHHSGSCLLQAQLAQPKLAG